MLINELLVGLPDGVAPQLQQLIRVLLPIVLQRKKKLCIKIFVRLAWSTLFGDGKNYTFPDQFG